MRMRTCQRTTASEHVYYDVSQGSVLGPILFNLYTADVSTVVRSSRSAATAIYVDDCQLYVSRPGVSNC